MAKKSVGTLPIAIDALQTQYNRERQNGAFYDALAGAFEKMNWGGFAAWAYRAAQEERAHAKQIFDHIADLDEQPRVDALEAVVAAADVVGAFQSAYDSEVANLAALYATDAQAESMGDKATCYFLIDLIRHQVEDIRNLSNLVMRVRVAAGDACALILLDKELAAQ